MLVGQRLGMSVIDYGASLTAGNSRKVSQGDEYSELPWSECSLPEAFWLPLPQTTKLGLRPLR